MLSEEDIEAMVERAERAVQKPTLHGHTYEEGVFSALEWVLEQEEEPPVEDVEM